MTSDATHPFRLYRRQRPNGKAIYYVRFRLPDGTWTAGRSTRETSPRRAEARAWAMLEEGGAARSINTTLSEFADGFFDWDGEWAVDKRSAGQRLSPEHCEKTQTLAMKHVVPRIGRKRLQEIDTEVVKRLRADMYRAGYAGSTINKALDALRAILETAEDKRLVRGLPRFTRAGLNQDERGILTQEEVRQLFGLLWPDQRAYVANLVAASTGFRLGEVLGIRHRDVHEGRLEICGSWNSTRREWKPGTKNGQPKRSVPIPQTVEEHVRALLEAHPDPGADAYLFYSTKGENAHRHPIEHSVVTRAFYTSLRRLDPPVTEEERRRRNITFHSHRHFFNSLLVESRIPLQKIQRLTGHLSDSMTQRYYHTDSLEDVAEVQKQAFQIVIGGAA